MSAECIIRILRKQGLQLAERLRKFVGCKVDLDQQIVRAGKVWDRVGASFEASVSELNPIFPTATQNLCLQKNGRLANQASFETDAVSSVAQRQNAFPASPVPQVDCNLATS